MAAGHLISMILQFLTISVLIFSYLVCLGTVSGQNLVWIHDQMWVKNLFDLMHGLDGSRTFGKMHIISFLESHSVFSTYAALLFTGPLVKIGFNLIHHFLIILFAGDVKVHVAIANVSIADTAHNVVSQPGFHSINTLVESIKG